MEKRIRKIVVTVLVLAHVFVLASCKQPSGSDGITTNIKTFENIESKNIGTVIAVKGGSFTYQEGESYQIPNTRVKDFYLSETEITQSQWKLVMKNIRPDGKSSFERGEGENHPMYYVSWYDAIEFCNALTRKELGEDNVAYYVDANNDGMYNELVDINPVVTLNNSGNVVINENAAGYRLPTKEEWEYAAGGGSSSRTLYAGTNSEDKVGQFAWYSKNYDESVGEDGANPVFRKNANSLGLHDMCGNVREWCWDNFTSSSKVVRGGYWFSSPEHELNILFNSGVVFTHRGQENGFRVARSVEQGEDK